MAKDEVKDRVILFGDISYTYDNEKEIWNKVEGDHPHLVEILEVKEVLKDRITTEKFEYVFPLAEAKRFTSAQGTVYAYNVSLPYLNELRHLASVEQNIIMGQALLYEGKNNPIGKTPAVQWVMLAGLIVICLAAVFS